MDLGIEAFVKNLSRRKGAGIVGANVGKNRDSADAAADYITGITAIAGLADYLVINISSPNTPGLRGLQARAQLQELLARVQAARIGKVAASGAARPPPLLVKAGLAASNGEATRKIKEGAVSVDGQKVTDFQKVYTVDAPVVVRLGRKYARLIP